MTKREVWLINKIKTFQFPVTPSEFEVNFGSMNKTVNLLNFGELNLMGENKLREWSISGVFPYRENPSVCCKLLNSNYYCRIIDNLMYNKQVCRFVITGTRLNNACTIQNFTYGEKDGTGDIYFTINFKEHKVVGREKLVVI